MSYSIPTEDNAKFLQTRPWRRPIHDEAQRRLQKFYPNTLVVAVPNGGDVERFIDAISEPMVSTKNNTILFRMETSECHENVSELLSEGAIKDGCYGYALSDDGLWREHSWGITDSGLIIETTTRRLAYVCLAVRVAMNKEND